MPLIELNGSRKSFIADLAERVFLDMGGHVPVEPTLIMDAEDITFTLADYGAAFDGLIEHKAGRFHIYCNIRDGQYSSQTRVRFTLGHELGHYFIDEHRNALASGRSPAHPSFVDSHENSVVEAEANAFASCLLMPKGKFAREVAGQKPDLQGLINLSSTFLVSAQATAIRFVQECRIPCAAIMFRNQSRPWAAISPSLRKLGYQQIADINAAELPMDFATAKARATTGSGLSEIFRNQSTASFWFKGVGPTASRNLIITEQAVRLGWYGVLTLLLFPSLGPAST